MLLWNRIFCIRYCSKPDNKNIFVMIKFRRIVYLCNTFSYSPVTFFMYYSGSYKVFHMSVLFVGSHHCFCLILTSVANVSHWPSRLPHAGVAESVPYDVRSTSAQINLMFILNTRLNQLNALIGEEAVCSTVRLLFKLNLILKFVKRGLHLQGHHGAYDT